MSGDVLQTTLASGLVAGIPLLYAALGELLMERVGVLNIGLDGIMLMGAVGGFIVAYRSGSVTLGFGAGAATGAMFTLVLFGLPVLFLRSSQVLVGFALWFIGLGLSAQLGQSYTTKPLRLDLPPTNVPVLHDIPFVGPILFEQIWPVYAGVALAVAVNALMRRTRHGLEMRAIGDDPASAHAAGISVLRWQTFYIGIGGALAGLGGAVLSVAISEGWKEGITAGRGWVALALVIFAAWRPLGLLWGTYLFGVLLVLGDVGQAQGWRIPSPFLGMVPFVVTVVILVVRTWRAQRGGGSMVAPRALGHPFAPGQR